MASFAISHLSSVSSSSSLCFNFGTKIRASTSFNLYPNLTLKTKSLTVKASSASLDYAVDKSSVSSKTGDWQWKFKDNSIKIHYGEHGNDSNGPSKNILMMPTISDVSTVEEWRLVAKDIVERSGNVNWRTTIVDWPGLGYSDRPKLDYNADVMETFFVDLILAQDSPISSSEDLVIVGGGHAATLAIRAAKKGLVKPTAIAAVAPTWSGPLPIVFGRDSKTESRCISPVLVVSTSGAPRRSKAEMEALREAKGVSKFVEVPGALLPHEEYPTVVAKELYSFLQNLI